MNLYTQGVGMSLFTKRVAVTPQVRTSIPWFAALWYASRGIQLDT